MSNIIEFKNITKTFLDGKIIANNNVTFGIKKGTIHAIAGENGAGKSTLLSMLFGIYNPTEGEIFVRGEKVKYSSAADAMSDGLGMVHQHFQLVETYTVGQNILLGKEKTSFGFINKKSDFSRINEISKKYGFGISAEQKISSLTVGQEQKTEILKLLFSEAEILIFDEPTAMLIPSEIEELLNVMISLKNEGKTIILITHKLDEIKKVADEVTVLRKGEYVGSISNKDLTAKNLSKMMIGSDLVEVTKTFSKGSEVVLQVKDLVVAGKDSSKFSFDNEKMKVNLLKKLISTDINKLNDKLTLKTQQIKEVEIKSKDKIDAIFKKNVEKLENLKSEQLSIESNFVQIKKDYEDLISSDISKVKSYSEKVVSLNKDDFIKDIDINQNTANLSLLKQSSDSGDVNKIETSLQSIEKYINNQRKTETKKYNHLAKKLNKEYKASRDNLHNLFKEWKSCESKHYAKLSDLNTAIESLQVRINLLNKLQGENLWFDKALPLFTFKNRLNKLEASIKKIESGIQIFDYRLPLISIASPIKVLIENFKSKNNVELTIASAKLKGASFELKAGEILAVAGVEGNGQSQLVNALLGLEKEKSGLINVHNSNGITDVTKLNIKSRNELFASIPEDRHKYGMVLDMKVYDNLTIKNFDTKYSKFGFINKSKIRRDAAEIIKDFDVRGADGGNAVSRGLSGGNQQKAVVGREIKANKGIMLIFQATRGLDVGAINYIHEQIIKSRNDGKAILLVSYDVNEVIKLADRVLVLNAGKITGELVNKEISKERLGILMSAKGGTNE